MSALRFHAGPLSLCAANDDTTNVVILLRSANDAYLPDVVA